MLICKQYRRLQVAVDQRQCVGQGQVIEHQLAVAPGQAGVVGVRLAEAGFRVGTRVARLHAGIEAVPRLAAGVAADQDRPAQQGDPHLIVIQPDVELGTGDAYLATRRTYDERMVLGVTDIKEGFAVLQGDPTLVLVIGIG
ncbi:hypothetical protein D9M71_158210 [compost metagenome]